jgi:hypothetical protein
LLIPSSSACCSRSNTAWGLSFFSPSIRSLLCSAACHWAKKKYLSSAPFFIRVCILLLRTAAHPPLRNFRREGDAKRTHIVINAIWLCEKLCSRMSEPPFRWVVVEIL